MPKLLTRIVSLILIPLLLAETVPAVPGVPRSVSQAPRLSAVFTSQAIPPMELLYEHPDRMGHAPPAFGIRREVELFLNEDMGRASGRRKYGGQAILQGRILISIVGALALPLLAIGPTPAVLIPLAIVVAAWLFFQIQFVTDHDNTSWPQTFMRTLGTFLFLNGSAYETAHSLTSTLWSHVGPHPILYVLALVFSAAAALAASGIVHNGWNRFWRAVGRGDFVLTQESGEEAKGPELESTSALKAIQTAYEFNEIWLMLNSADADERESAASAFGPLALYWARTDPKRLIGNLLPLYQSYLLGEGANRNERNEAARQWSVVGEAFLAADPTGGSFEKYAMPLFEKALSSPYFSGQRANTFAENARRLPIDLVKADPSLVLFTSVWPRLWALMENSDNLGSAAQGLAEAALYAQKPSKFLETHVLPLFDENLKETGAYDDQRGIPAGLGALGVSLISCDPSGGLFRSHWPALLHDVVVNLRGTDGDDAGNSFIAVFDFLLTHHAARDVLGKEVWELLRKTITWGPPNPRKQRAALAFSAAADLLLTLDPSDTLFKEEWLPAAKKVARADNDSVIYLMNGLPRLVRALRRSRPAEDPLQHTWTHLLAMASPHWRQIGQGQALRVWLPALAEAHELTGPLWNEWLGVLHDTLQSSNGRISMEGLEVLLPLAEVWLRQDPSGALLQEKWAELLFTSLRMEYYGSRKGSQAKTQKELAAVMTLANEQYPQAAERLKEYFQSYLMAKEAKERHPAIIGALAQTIIQSGLSVEPSALNQVLTAVPLDDPARTQAVAQLAIITLTEILHRGTNPTEAWVAVMGFLKEIGSRELPEDEAAVLSRLLREAIAQKGGVLGGWAIEGAYRSYFDVDTLPRKNNSPKNLIGHVLFDYELQRNKLPLAYGRRLRERKSPPLYSQLLPLIAELGNRDPTLRDALTSFNTWGEVYSPLTADTVNVRAFRKFFRRGGPVAKRLLERAHLTLDEFYSLGDEEILKLITGWWESADLLDRPVDRKLSEEDIRRRNLSWLKSQFAGVFTENKLYWESVQKILEEAARDRVAHQSIGTWPDVVEILLRSTDPRVVAYRAADDKAAYFAQRARELSEIIPRFVQNIFHFTVDEPRWNDPTEKELNIVKFVARNKEFQSEHHPLNAALRAYFKARLNGKDEEEAEAAYRKNIKNVSGMTALRWRLRRFLNRSRTSLWSPEPLSGQVQLTDADPAELQRLSDWNGARAHLKEIEPKLKAAGIVTDTLRYPAQILAENQWIPNVEKIEAWIAAHRAQWPADEADTLTTIEGHLAEIRRITQERTQDQGSRRAVRVLSPVIDVVIEAAEDPIETLHLGWPRLDGSCLDIVQGGYQTYAAGYLLNPAVKVIYIRDPKNPDVPLARFSVGIDPEKRILILLSPIKSSTAYEFQTLAGNYLKAWADRQGLSVLAPARLGYSQRLGMNYAEAQTQVSLPPGLVPFYSDLTGRDVQEWTMEVPGWGYGPAFASPQDRPRTEETAPLDLVAARQPRRFSPQLRLTQPGTTAKLAEWADRPSGVRKWIAEKTPGFGVFRIEDVGFASGHR